LECPEYRGSYRDGRSGLFHVHTAIVHTPRLIVVHTTRIKTT
jgi:hypothetical protein